MTGRATSAEAVRVAIDARIPDGQWGGVQQVTQGLASGIGKLDGPDEFVFLTERDGAGWLRPLLSRNSRVVEVPAGYGRTAARRAYDAVAGRVPAAARTIRAVASRLGAGSMPLPRSDGFVEGLGVDLVHFMTPQAYLTTVPSVYQPHDLLHRHFPEQFSPVHARYREHAYSTFSTRASVVAVMTEFGRRDLTHAYELAPDKVAVVPWAPAIGSESASSGLPEGPSLSLPDRYILYPAQTWPHKNHIRLIEAMALLRDRGNVVPLICTGRQNEHFPAIRRRIEALSLDSQVTFTGYLTPRQLEWLLQRASALIFPSLFEGWGLPVVEAFSLGIPVACSNTSALPEVASGAALLFDPNDTGSIAGAVIRVVGDDPLRADLRSRGRARADELSWTKSARIFRAIYRFVAGRELSDEDRALLAPPTLSPQPETPA